MQRKWLKRGKRFEVSQPMGWERGYYYRVRKVNGRVVREYIGTGEIAELSAELDAIRRADREAEQAAQKAEKAELEFLETDIRKLSELTDLAARAALLAAGYHQHNRGEWRKRREQRRPAIS